MFGILKNINYRVLLTDAEITIEAWFLERKIRSLEAKGSWSRI